MQNVCVLSKSLNCDLLCVRTGSLSGRADRPGPAHPASPLAGRRPANHKHRPGDADQHAGESSANNCETGVSLQLN